MDFARLRKEHITQKLARLLLLETLNRCDVALASVYKEAAAAAKCSLRRM